MKSMFVIALLIAVVAVVCGEQCGNNHDCAQHGITTCSNAYHVVCHNHQCECTNGPTGHACNSAADCSCNNGRTPHCVDNGCQCSRV